MAPQIVIMGICGSGKTVTACELAKRLNLTYKDADVFHPQSNVKKMLSGSPLTDKDRLPWLETLNRILQSEKGIILACSALRKSYREILTKDVNILFLHLQVDIDIIHTRMSSRIDHFMPSFLIQSQMIVLEPLCDDENGYCIDVGSEGIDNVVEKCVELYNSVK